MSDYQNLESRMKALAAADGDPFLPNPEPTGPVDYVFICMEPSIDGWAESYEDAERRVKEGFRNFIAGLDVMLLHFAVRKYLCQSDETYYITDLSKGAMLVEKAKDEAIQRYDRWYEVLVAELDLLSKPNTVYFAVGKAVEKQLRRRQFPGELVSLMHYSPVARPHRARLVRGHEAALTEFAGTLSREEILATAREVLEVSGVQTAECREAMDIVDSPHLLSSSSCALVFVYKMMFESLQRRSVARP